MIRTVRNTTKADGLPAVRKPNPEQATILPDLCHHALYEIYVNGHYVESVGNLGGNAQRALEFYQRRRRRKQMVEVKVMPCRVAGCSWGKS